MRYVLRHGRCFKNLKAILYNSPTKTYGRTELLVNVYKKKMQNLNIFLEKKQENEKCETQKIFLWNKHIF